MTKIIVSIILVIVAVLIVRERIAIDKQNPLSQVEPSPTSELQAFPSQTQQTPSITPVPTAIITPVSTSTTSSGLKIEDLVVGNGKEVKAGDNITINYLGTLADGTKFDSSYDRNQPFQTKIGVGQVIKGWDEGVIGMKVGGKRKLTIPPDLGYGSQGAGNLIPPNSTLIFTLELLEVK